MSIVENFLKKSKNVHNNKYDYSLVDYKNSYTKVKIICPIHGVFEQRPDIHIRGSGCKKCHIKKNTKTTQIFINESKEIHGDKYDYSLVDYKNSYTKVKIICLIHGVFEQNPNNHISKKYGCIKCISNDNLSFIKKAKETHGDKYDYSLVNYKNNLSKIKIICPIHGIFEQTPTNHLNTKIACVKCYHDKLKNDNSYFIKKAKEVHGDKYDYSLVDYKNNRIKIKIICPIHGIFNQSPSSHIKSSGCPHCNESKGEKKIFNILNNKNISMIRQHTFEDCKNKYPLKFDFYLPDFNICIEYDGEQHFKKFRFEKNNNNLKIRKKLDNIKNEYCSKNNIRLIRIKYTDDINLEINKIYH